MNVLSVFDGMSCGRIALDRAGIKYSNYFASEIDKFALKIATKNYPDNINLGNIKNVDYATLPKIGLLLGGSPCQSLAIAKRQKESGLKKGESVLFWEFVAALRQIRPKYFLFENVASMKKIDKEQITQALGVEPIMINSALVSAQQRKRFYWTNIPGVTQPEDRNIYLKDILETGYTERLKSYCVTATYANTVPVDYFDRKNRQLVFTKPVRVATIGKGGRAQRVYSIDGKSISISASNGGLGSKTGLYEIRPYVRKLTPLECKRLQTLPFTGKTFKERGYTEGVSNAQRYKMLGKGWTVDVIVHILNGLNERHQKRRLKEGREQCSEEKISE